MAGTLSRDSLFPMNPKISSIYTYNSRPQLSGVHLYESPFVARQVADTTCAMFRSCHVHSKHDTTRIAHVVSHPIKTFCLIPRQNTNTIEIDEKSLTTLRWADLRFALVDPAPHLAAPVEISDPPAKRSDAHNQLLRVGTLEIRREPSVRDLRVSIVHDRRFDKRLLRYRLGGVDKS